MCSCLIIHRSLSAFIFTLIFLKHFWTGSYRVLSSIKYAIWLVHYLWRQTALRGLTTKDLNWRSQNLWLLTIQPWRCYKLLPINLTYPCGMILLVLRLVERVFLVEKSGILEISNTCPFCILMLKSSSLYMDLKVKLVLSWKAKK